MEQSFADRFGHVHIGTNKEKSSHSRVTELNFIRWRATIFGTIGQRIIAAIRADNSSRSEGTVAKFFMYTMNIMT